MDEDLQHKPFVWIVLIQKTGETVEKTMPSGETVECLKIKAFSCVSSKENPYDQTYDHIDYLYTGSFSQPYKSALVEDTQPFADFTGGTTPQLSTVPTFTKDGFTYTAQLTLESNVYVPYDECRSQAFFKSNLSKSQGGEFDKKNFVYSRKGSLRASDMVITGYENTFSCNLVDANFGSAVYNPSKTYSAVETITPSAAYVDAKLTQVEARPYMHETSEDGVYSLE